MDGWMDGHYRELPIPGMKSLVFILYERVERIKICELKSFCPVELPFKAAFKKEGAYLRRLPFKKIESPLTLARPLRNRVAPFGIFDTTLP